VTKGGDIASAGPLVIDTDGNYFDVTGTTGFAAMTVTAGRRFTLQFDGVLTMTHHATNLDLPGEANITTAAGDVAEFFSTGSDTVQCVNYTKADGTSTVAGKIVQVVNVQSGAMATGTTQTPLDDTIPQNTEGTEFMTLAITPTDTSNNLLIEVVVNYASSVTNGRTIALHQDAIASAIACCHEQSAAEGDELIVMSFNHYMAAGTISETTFKVRIGGSNASTITFNGASGARRNGGVLASSITITEID
jgi:hypothetical protein